MTEAQWLATGNPSSLLDFERHRRPVDRVPGRKLRHYVCACCRHLPAELFAGRLPEAVDLVERFVDREASAEEFNRFRGRLVYEEDRLDSRPMSATRCVVSSNIELWSAAARITELLA